VPIVAPNNNFLLAVAKQTNEATTSATATYSVPVYSANVTPTYDERRVEVTDASSLQSDVYKGLTYWTAEAEFPAYSRSLGTFLQSLWPTDTKTGAGPFTHTFSGLGGTQSWMALYTEWPGAAAFEQTFGKGQATGIGFTADQEGGPLRIRYTAMGETPSVTAYSVTTADDQTQGYFTLQSATATIKTDLDTPNVTPTVSATNVQAVTINVDRPAVPVYTADGISVTNIGVGKVVPTGTATFIYPDGAGWESYRATYYGSVAGTAVSPTVVQGALKLNFTHTTDATATFSLYCPAVQFKATAPTPAPAGDPLVFEVALNIMKPSSGDHVQPVLINGLTAVY
jgi:hypothetical protein